MIEATYNTINNFIKNYKRIKKQIIYLVWFVLLGSVDIRNVFDNHRRWKHL